MSLGILADPNIAAVEAAFSVFGSVNLVPGRQWNAELVRGYDVLLVRSVTRVDADLLAGSRVRFVGTATSGLDHVDTGYLRSAGIEFVDAAGSNAESVVEYVLSVLSAHAEIEERPFASYTIGIVGCGAIGARLQRRLLALGARVLANDPPRAGREGAAGFDDLDTVVAAADLVTLHVPLIDDGDFPTRSLIGAKTLARLGRGTVLVNAARGGVVVEGDLLAALARDPSLRPVLDCWQGEPAIDAELARRTWLATPHCAGYSWDGKLRATRMLFDGLNRHCGTAHPAPLALQTPVARRVRLPAVPTDADLRRLLLDCYDARADSQALKSSLDWPAPDRTRHFDAMRRDYPRRHEYGAVAVTGVSSDGSRKLHELGFRVEAG